MLLDCCRNWPFSVGKRSLGGKRGLGQADASALSHEESIGSMVGFAAAAGAAAHDASKRVPGHSPYTAALLESFTAPGLKLDRALARVTDSVVKDTGGQQEPASYKHRWGEEAMNLVLFPPAPTSAALDTK